MRFRHWINVLSWNIQFDVIAFLKLAPEDVKVLKTAAASVRPHSCEALRLAGASKWNMTSPVRSRGGPVVSTYCPVN